MITRPVRSGLNLRDVRRRAQVLLLLMLSTPLFVAPTLDQAWRVYKGIFTLTPGPVEWHHVLTVAYGVAMVVLIDRHQQTFEADEDRRGRGRRMGREDEATDVSLLSSWNWQWRTAAMVLAIVVFGANIQAAEFYYFQF